MGTGQQQLSCSDYRKLYMIGEIAARTARYYHRSDGFACATRGQATRGQATRGLSSFFSLFFSPSFAFDPL